MWMLAKASQSAFVRSIVCSGELGRGEEGNNAGTAGYIVRLESEHAIENKISVVVVRILRDRDRIEGSLVEGTSSVDVFPETD